jgi:hypothetical protein
MDELDRFAPKAARKIRKEFTEVFAALDGFEDEWGRFEGETQEAAEWVLEALQDALQNCGAPYTWFGAHDGDASDFGYWVDFDNLEEDIRSGDLLTWQETREAHCYRAGTLAADINDHGNVSLLEVRYHNGKREWRNVWAVV